MSEIVVSAFMQAQMRRWPSGQRNRSLFRTRTRTLALPRCPAVYQQIPTERRPPTQRQESRPKTCQVGSAMGERLLSICPFLFVSGEGIEATPTSKSFRIKSRALVGDVGDAYVTHAPTRSAHRASRDVNGYTGMSCAGRRTQQWSSRCDLVTSLAP